MQNSNLLILIIISLLIFSALLFYVSVISYGFELDTLQKIFSIIGSLSLVIALATYITNERRIKTIAVKELLSFYRKEIILEWDRVAKVIKAKNPLGLSRIKIDIRTLDFIRNQYPDNFNVQSNIFINKIEEIKKTGDLTDSEISTPVISILNMIEEFAVKVLHSKLQNHEVLKDLHSSFVEIVENNAFSILFMREIIDNSFYLSILNLYDFWKEGIDRSNFKKLKRFQKNGFITKKEMESILVSLRNKKTEKS